MYGKALINAPYIGTLVIDRLENCEFERCESRVALTSKRAAHICSSSTAGSEASGVSLPFPKVGHTCEKADSISLLTDRDVRLEPVVRVLIVVTPSHARSRRGHRGRFRFDCRSQAPVLSGSMTMSVGQNRQLWSRCDRATSLPRSIKMSECDKMGITKRLEYRSSEKGGNSTEQGVGAVSLNLSVAHKS